MHRQPATSNRDAAGAARWLLPQAIVSPDAEPARVGRTPLEELLFVSLTPRLALVAGLPARKSPAAQLLAVRLRHRGGSR